MKMKAVLLLVLLFSTSHLIHAQKNQDPSIIHITTIDGDEFKGEITYQDSALIVLTTKTLGPITIQKKDIKYQGIKNGFTEIKKNGISANLLGTAPFLGLTYERLLSGYFSLEAGVGLVSLGGGIKIYPFKAKEGQAIFHTGLTVAHEYYTEYTVSYIPLGVSFFGRKGLNLGIDLGPSYYTDGYDSFFLIYGNVKLGIRF